MIWAMLQNPFKIEPFYTREKFVIAIMIRIMFTITVNMLPCFYTRKKDFAQTVITIAFLETCLCVPVNQTERHILYYTTCTALEAIRARFIGGSACKVT